MDELLALHHLLNYRVSISLFWLIYNLVYLLYICPSLDKS